VCSVSGIKLRNDVAAAAELCSNNQQAEVSDAGDDGRGEVNSDATGTSVVECDSFCDFIRFEGTVTEHHSLSPGGLAGNRLAGDDGRSGTLLRACIEKYKMLFEALIAARILQDSQSVMPSFMDQFVTSSGDKPERDSRSVSPSHVSRVNRVELTGLTKGVMETFSLSCQLLVDFSALPIYSDLAVLSPAANGSGKKFWF